MRLGEAASSHAIAMRCGLTPRSLAGAEHRRVARERGVLVLHAHERVAELAPRDRELSEVDVRDTDSPHEPVVHELAQRAHRLGVGGPGVRPVVLVQRQLVEAEARKRGSRGGGEVGGAAVDPPGGVRAARVAALSGDDDAFERAGHLAKRTHQGRLVEPHLAARAVAVGGVEEGDPGVKRGVHRTLSASEVAVGKLGERHGPHAER